jgi:hypothetical protein
MSLQATAAIPLRVDAKQGAGLFSTLIRSVRLCFAKGIPIEYISLS